MYSVILDPAYPVTRRIYAPVLRDDFGGGILQLVDRIDIPFYEFSILLPFEDEAVHESLDAAAAFNKGAGPFWFDGGRFGEVRNPRIIGIGDGTRTSWFLPFRNVDANACVFEINRVVNTSWTLTESTGNVVFGSAPANNAQIVLTRARMRFKCVFWYQDAYIYQPKLIYNQLYDCGELVLREVP